MAKSKGLAMGMKPVTVRGIDINNLFYLINDHKHNGEVVLFHQNDKGINEIKRRVVQYIKGMDREYMAELSIVNCFKSVQCEMCFDTRSAILTTKTEIGNCCLTCYTRMSPRPTWIQLDNIEKYIT